MLTNAPKSRMPGDHALDDIADAQLFQQLGFAAGAPFSLGFAFAEDQPAAVLVDLDDFDAKRAADELAHGFAAVG